MSCKVVPLLLVVGLNGLHVGWVLKMRVLMHKMVLGVTGIPLDQIDDPREEDTCTFIDLGNVLNKGEQ